MLRISCCVLSWRSRHHRDRRQYLALESRDRIYSPV